MKKIVSGGWWVVGSRQRLRFIFVFFFLTATHDSPLTTHPLYAASPNRVVIRTSDGTLFSGSLEDKDGNLVMIKTDEGEDLNLPIEEITAINGAAPASFFKRFIPVIPESRFQTLAVSPNPNLRYTFKFLSNWHPSKLSNGFTFSGPDDDPRWEGFRFTVSLEAPLTLTGDQSYKAVLDRLTKAGSMVLSESYETVLGTPTLRTTEMAKGNFAVRALRQLRIVNGQKCLLEVSMSSLMKDKLNRPMAIALFEKVVGSIKFPK